MGTAKRRGKDRGGAASASSAAGGPGWAGLGFGRGWSWRIGRGDGERRGVAQGQRAGAVVGELGAELLPVQGGEGHRPHGEAGGARGLVAPGRRVVIDDPHGQGSAGPVVASHLDFPVHRLPRLEPEVTGAQIGRRPGQRQLVGQVEPFVGRSQNEGGHGRLGAARGYAPAPKRYDGSANPLTRARWASKRDHPVWQGSPSSALLNIRIIIGNHNSLIINT